MTRERRAVAVIRPPDAHLVSAERFRELIATAPPADHGFAGELRAAEPSHRPSRHDPPDRPDAARSNRERGDGSTERLLGEEDRAISVITVSELLHGVHRAAGERRARRRAFVEHLLAGIQAIPITEAVARVHAELWAQLTERGEPIGAHDLWIAATAVAHGLGVATGNAARLRAGPRSSGRPRGDTLDAMRRRVAPVDRVGVDERAAVLGKRSIKSESQQQAIRMAVSMVDLTTLEGQDTPGKVAQLAAKAVCPAPTHPEIPSVAALCVYPSRVADAKRRARTAPAWRSPASPPASRPGLT